MSRQSVRKVKLTSKFEEFNSARLSIQQRSANHHHHNNTISTTPQQQHDTTSTTNSQNVLETPIKVETTKAQVSETPATPAAATPATKERSAHKVLRQKTAPVTPAYEPSSTPTSFGGGGGHITPLPKLTANGKIRGRPRKCWQKAETVVTKPISSTREELLRLREENINLKAQLEQRTVEFEDLKRQSSYTGQTVPKVDYDDLKEKYQRDMTHAKRHEWCVVCLNPSRYYCCWNTTYCSQKCQVADWYNRHIKSCERRKALKTVS